MVGPVSWHNSLCKKLPWTFQIRFIASYRGTSNNAEVWYSNMLQSMDELIIAGTSSLSWAIKYPMSQITWTTSPHMAETLTMCWETWCSFDLNTIKFNGLYKHRCEVIKLWFSKTWWSMPWGSSCCLKHWILLIARDKDDVPAIMSSSMLWSICIRPTVN